MNNNIGNIILQVERKCKLRPYDMVALQRQGEYYAETKSMDIRNRPHILKLNKYEYMVLKTRKIKRYAPKTETKTNKNLRKTFATLRGLIRANFTSGSTKQLFVTLHYKENMQDPKRLYNDFKNFMARLRREYSRYKFEYIVVMEPQGRGAWHAHILLKSDRYLYIDNRDTTRIWGLGGTETVRLKSNDVGTYYVAYFTDVLTPEGEAEYKKSPNERKITEKMRKKGERLHMYPKNFKFYRTSRGIKKPTEEVMKYSDVIEEYGKPIYSTITNIKDFSTDDLLNRVHFTVHKKDKEVNE